jgi:hypothetical protein
VTASYHVDYWDRLGWRDPFSDARWTERQTQTGRALRQSDLYTPELVWRGRGHGSAADARVELVRALAAKEKARASIELEVTVGAKRLVARGEVAPASGERLAAGLVLELLVLEDDLTTEVKRGENDGRTLRESSVVRAVTQAKKLEVAASDPVPFEATFDIAESWKREKLHAAAVLREPAARVWQALDVAPTASSS